MSNYHLQIYTWPAMRGAPVGYRDSFHAALDEAISHLDSQTEPYAYATLSRLAGFQYLPCDWSGRSVLPGDEWPVRRGANGEHPAYLVYLADKDNLIAEILRRRNEQGGGIVDITHDVLKERHPLITQTEALAREIVGL